MTYRKISDFVPFVGRDLLLVAQARGVKIMGPDNVGIDAIAPILMGLGNLLEESANDRLKEIIRAEIGDAMKAVK